MRFSGRFGTCAIAVILGAGAVCARASCYSELLDRLDTPNHDLARGLIIACALLCIATVFFGTWTWGRRKLAVEARDAAAERLAAVSRLTGGVAHDFNNLLSVLQQALWLLTQRAAIAADPVAADLVTQAQQSTEACAGITSQLLSFARQQNLEPEPVKLGEFLAALLPMLERAAAPKATVTLDPHDSGPVAWVDPRKLTAALQNLVANARDAMVRDGLIILRTSAAVDGRVCIAVIDNGEGMTADVLARAVEPFFTTKAVGQGSGLGLSMVAGFATQSGGELKIASIPTRGTTVTLWLPGDRP